VDQKVSPLIVVMGMIVIAAFGLAAILFVDQGPESNERLGLFFALIGTATAALVGALRADQTKQQTNGSLDQRIQDAVFQANAVRRKSDVIPPEADNAESPVKP